MRILEYLKDVITVIVLAVFLLGCYATTHRGPKTLAPGEVSGSVSYLRFKSVDADPEDDPGELLGIEGRVGVIKGVDVGYMRTMDISEGVDDPDEGIDTHWFDAKFQILNRDNLLNKPILSLGYGFGNVINIDETWVNTLYFSLGTEMEKATLFYSYRYEIFDDKMNLIPKWLWEKDFEDVRKAHILGLEYSLTNKVRPVIEVGRFFEEEFEDGLNVFTLGANYYFNTR